MEDNNREIELSADDFTDEFETFLEETATTFSIDVIDSLFLSIYATNEEYSFEDFEGYVLASFPEDHFDENQYNLFKRHMDNLAVVMKDDFNGDAEYYTATNSARIALIQIYMYSFEMAGAVYFGYTSSDNEVLHHLYDEVCNSQRRVVSILDNLNMPDEAERAWYLSGKVKSFVEKETKSMHKVNGDIIEALSDMSEFDSKEELLTVFNDFDFGSIEDYME